MSGDSGNSSGKGLSRVIWVCVAAVACALLVWRWGFSYSAAKFSLLTVALVFAAANDAAEYRIPNAVVLAVFALWVACFALEWLAFGASPLELLGHALLGAVAAVALPLVLTLAAEARGKDGFGGGDLKLLAVVGLFFGWQANLAALVLACVAGALIGLTLRASTGERRLPFGCGIALGWWLMMLL